MPYMHGYQVQRLMVDEGSVPTILFANCWVRMKLLDEIIHDVTDEIAGFNGYKYKLKGRVTLIISLRDKHMVINFLHMNYTAHMIAPWGIN